MRERCPKCGRRCVLDQEGDTDVIGGTRDFWTCPDCGDEVIDEGYPLVMAEQIISAIWKKEAGE